MIPEKYFANIISFQISQQRNTGGNATGESPRRQPSEGTEKCSDEENSPQQGGMTVIARYFFKASDWS